MFVLVGIPIQQVLRAQDFAMTMYRLELDTPAKDDHERKARENRQKELRAQATLPHIYKTQVLPDIHFWLLAVALPPVLLYALIRAAILLGMWLYRGFKAP